MTLGYGHKTLQVLLFPFILAGMAAASPDLRLISLVPPGAQLLAGISARTAPGQPDNFVLMTDKTKLDLADFYALVGADGTRRIHQIVFVAMPDKTGTLNEHSLLASGHFDPRPLFKSATGAGATVITYSGIQVLEILPFARERATFNGVRWLAILDSSVAVFGSIATTKVEIDRYLARSSPNESLLRRFARLRSKDQTWCLLSASVRSLSFPAWEQEIRSVLAEVNPELAALALAADEFEFGIFYGRRVEFEYEVTLPPTGEERISPDSVGQPALQLGRSTSLLPPPNPTANAKTIHAMFAVPVSRYEAWLEEIRDSQPPVIS